MTRPKALAPKSLFLSFDIEGVCGVSTWSVQGAPGGRDFALYREMATAEVNAAIRGAVAAGIDEVVVADGHGDAQNLLIGQLHPAARLVQAWPRPLMMMEGIDRGHCASVFIGYHAREGTEGAILAHTMSTSFFEVRIDGTPVGELEINARLALEACAPLRVVSGDNAVCSAARALDPNIRTVETKRAIGFYAAEMRRPDVVIDEIEATVHEALANLTVAPVTGPRPVTLEIVFRQILSAEVAASLIGATRIDGRTVRFDATDIRAAVRHIGALQLLNRLDR